MNVFDEESPLADQQTAELCLTLALAGVSLTEAQAYGEYLHRKEPS
jgi:hypothetical protein